MSELLINASIILALSGVILAGIRFVIGPTAPDRAVALDGMTVISISFIVLITLKAGRVIYLDVALIYSILSFVGVMAIARYLDGDL